MHTLTAAALLERMAVYEAFMRMDAVRVPNVGADDGRAFLQLAVLALERLHRFVVAPDEAACLRQLCAAFDQEDDPAPLRAIARRAAPLLRQPTIARPVLVAAIVQSLSD